MKTGAIFDEPVWVGAAVAAAEVITGVHLGASRPGRLSRTSRDGHAGRNDGVLSDYGGVAEASLASATKAIEKARAILAAIEPLLPDDAVGNA